VTEERFAELVQRLEGEAEASPGGYKLRVGALAALGFLYIFGVLAILVGALGAVIWGLTQGSGRAGLRRIGSALAVLIYTIARAMWIRFGRPEGMELEKDDAPQLFAEIEAIRRRMRAPRVHRILLRNDVNAAAHQRPRLGLLGWQENTLIIGLPLLQSLSPDQARAVLAHEFGHLSGAHSRFGGFIYRVRSTWSRLLAKLEEEDHWSSFVFRPFFRWYSPYFDAYTFVLARANEYEADLAGAELSSARDMGDALASVDLKDTYLEHRFWRWVSDQAELRPEPDVAPYTRMAKLLPAAPEPEDAEHWLPQYLGFETTLADTHPSLRDRLAALGVEARVPERVEHSAADAWLGDAHARLAGRLDDEWRTGQEEGWRAYHQGIREKETRIEELQAKAGKEPLEEDEAWDLACLVEERRPAAEALPLYVAYAERNPDRAGARFHAGRLLLDAGDKAGIEHLEASMTQTEDAIVPACERIASFLDERGESERAATYRARLAEHQAQLDAVADERDTLPTDVEYLPHEADAQDLAVLAEDLQKIPSVKQAWLTRRPLTLSEEPLYVLAVKRRRATWNPMTWDEWQKDPEKEDLALQAVIAEGARFPGQTKILVINHRGKLACELWTLVPGTQIFP
jgi:Zn-dependent protease with chaperone function